MCNNTVGSIDGDGAYQETLRASIRGPSLRLVVKVMRRKEKREKREERGRRGKKKPLFKMKKEKRKSEQSLTSIASHNNSRLSVCCVWFFSSSVVLNILQTSSFSDTSMLHSSQETPSYPLLCVTLKVINGFILFFQTNSFLPFSMSQRRSL